jgi:hypothetical protein
MRARFTTSGPKGRRGTVISFRLAAAAQVLFIVHGPSPDCGVAGRKVVRGRRGLNVVRLTGRFNGRMLRPGTYAIIVVAQRGEHRSRIGRIAVQVVRPRTLRHASGAPPVFRCSAVGSAEGSGLAAGLPVGARFEPPAPSGPNRSGVLAIPPLHLDGGSGSGLSRGLFRLLFYATLALAGSGLLTWALRH